MAKVEFRLDNEDLKRLETALQEIPDKAENVINEVLLGQAINILTEDVTRFIPMSRDQNKKKHARSSDWSKSQTFNLGFLLVSKGGAASNKNSFGYLVFPDEGRGIKNNVAHDFTGKGQNMAKPKIMDLLSANITKVIEEGL